MHIDRWNGGTLRRYHLPTGAILVTHANRCCRALPPFNHNISAAVSREEAAKQLRLARRPIRIRAKSAGGTVHILTGTVKGGKDVPFTSVEQARESLERNGWTVLEVLS